MTERMPTPPKVGTCYCGCGEETRGHFAQGHDGRALALLQALRREPPIVSQLVAAGFGPDGENLYETARAAGLLDSWRARHDRRR
jgi:hypothetical protein